MQARSLRLQARQKIARALHSKALVIEAKPVGAAELLSRPGTARSTVIALRHDNAVAGMRARNRRIDRKDASVAGTELAHHAQQELLIVGIDGSHQRAPSARDQRARL